MCGIFCSVYHTSNEQACLSDQKTFKFCKNVIAARGPDSLGEECRDLTEVWHGHFYASVLWMQGSKPTPQPIVDIDGNVLLWNGDVFGGNLFNRDACDTDSVSSALRNSTDIPSTLRTINGPFSVIYYQKSSKKLYFARDRFGRHSLLFRVNHDCNNLLLTSVSVKEVHDIMELPAIGIFSANLDSTSLEVECSPWFQPNDWFTEKLSDLQKQLPVDVNLTFRNNLPAIRELLVNKTISPKSGFLEFVEMVHEFKTYDEIMDHLLSRNSIKQLVDRLLVLLNESTRKRVEIRPKYCRDCINSSAETQGNCGHSKVGLLFSGGLDSTILAMLAHNYVELDESIDLINVAFKRQNNSTYEVPDRITGKQSYNELLEICSGRSFNFIEVNVPEEELEKFRSNRIVDLVYPHATVLDDSLACAVWFASRAKGTLLESGLPYESSCRVLLSGLGADEQLGGYMRHRTILKNKGWSDLTKELELEFDRISERNLGRDDRMVSDHGRQLRLPFLDEDFVNFLQNLLPTERCCPTKELPPGLGDKLLLRLLARKIGLREASKLPKRAFQFGSRIANRKENAKDLSKRL
ncbi:hypothetical protein QAD02_018267 [Eretmocerus hayati]|uniref:Uncharacterized protein n=1 Tax=Eretmocerus hayati TaxID=131215 RepID=A0ACC2PGD0_9HYME|nr:hypothetical protein QAD02_018267 [Eretmocerus hayati]